MFLEYNMPYLTPSAGQYIQIKRLQTGINGRIANTKPSEKRANDTYEGYAGRLLSTLPSNSLLSNKFIQPPPEAPPTCDLTYDSDNGWYFDPCTNLKYGDAEGMALIGYAGDITQLTSLTIISSVTQIGPNAFAGCSGLTSLTIPSNVTQLGPNSFNGCTNLQTLILSSTLTGIPSSCFFGCSSLIELTIPSSVTSIGSNAFNGCSSLTQLDIPVGMSNIGASAFYGCSSLTSLNILANSITIGFGAFTIIGGPLTVYGVIDNSNQVLSDMTYYFGVELPF
jgi:hypothetical protein